MVPGTELFLLELEAFLSGDGEDEAGAEGSHRQQEESQHPETACTSIVLTRRIFSFHLKGLTL